MNINVLVTGALYSQQSAYSAIRFCNAALAAGHTISQVFFYQEGVSQGTRLSVPLSDEFDAVTEWAKLHQHGIELLVCVSASERRGIVDSDQAAEFGLDQANLHSSFKVAGLGALHEATLMANRTVTFK